MNVRRRWFGLVPTVLAGLVFAAPRAGAEVQGPPNFVFILADDLGWADLGCYGSKFHESPNLDKLASQGMRFSDAYAACNVCSPTRASIITGKYPARLHLTTFLPGRSDRPSQKLLQPKINQFLPLDEVTLPQALKPAGYTSAAMGKWHLGAGPDYAPSKRGFDVDVGSRGGPWYFWPYTNPKAKEPPIPGGKEGEYLTDRLTDEAIKFIEANKDRPFFLYLAHHAVHIPLAAKKDLIAKYQAKAKTNEGQNNPIYAAMIESLDDGVGRIMQKLDELKLAERTVLVFTSDNGGLSVREGPSTPATSNAPLYAGKGYNYEGGIREPLIVRWPGVVKPGSVCGTPVLSMDFYPTFLELAGVKGDPKHVPDGVSLVAMLKGTGEPKRQALFWHYPHYSNQGGKPSGAVRQGDWKLIEFYEDGKRELYNLKDDIGEKNDLAAKMPDKVQELAKLLDDWRKDVKAQMPTPNPDYKAPKD
jgi:arylsulfatase A